MSESRDKSNQKTSYSRKERLAQALRANLKRRKQAGSSGAKAGKDRKSAGGDNTSG